MNLQQSSSKSKVVASQIGETNEVELILEGDDINMMILQDGNNNQIRQRVTESNHVDLNLIQEGNNHTIEQEFKNQSGIEMTIIQRGQNAQLKIIHN